MTTRLYNILENNNLKSFRDITALTAIQFRKLKGYGGKVGVGTITFNEMKEILAADPELRILYFTVSNNPTAFSYGPDEIREVYRAIEEDGRELAST